MSALSFAQAEAVLRAEHPACADAIDRFMAADREFANALRQIVPPVSPAPNPAIPVSGETSIPSGSTDPSPSVDHNTVARAFYSEVSKCG
jgi:hypothetical protein